MKKKRTGNWRLTLGVLISMLALCAIIWLTCRVLYYKGYSFDTEESADLGALLLSGVSVLGCAVAGAILSFTRFGE